MLIKMTRLLVFLAVAAPAVASAFAPADFVRHVSTLRKTLPRGFSIVVEPPFVVVGDEPLELVRLRAARTVRWATAQLKRAYFAKDPEAIITVWLLKDAASYERTTLRLFGEQPGTPYGFYSRAKRVLVMNIATGGGTLVHEMVHPFIESNFPGCPPWFNEGLGSLYEQSSERDGGIVGLTNWRLAGLQAAIRRRALPSFKALAAMSSKQFYDEDRGSNYAQARYLLYYLQERGLLRRYYAAFARGRAADPSGHQTLAATLGERDLAAFQKRWEAFVLKLRFE
jgi:hypothetical protein